MTFEKYFSALGDFAQRATKGKKHAQSSPEEIGQFLGLSKDEAIGAYEAYTRDEKSKYIFIKEYVHDKGSRDWEVRITKKES